jgi:hypothetical protein
MPKRNWLAALSLVAALSALPAPAEATTITPATVEQLVDASDLIVRGTVTEVWTEADDRGTVWTRTQIEVTSQLKGAEVDSVVVDQLGGVFHNDYAIVLGSPRFSPGEDALFFLEHLGNGRTSVTGWFQGKYTVRIDPDSGREMLVRFYNAQDQVYDHRFIPHPAPEDRVFLDDMEQRVLDRVELGWDGQPIVGVPEEKLRRINKLQPGVE